MMTSSNGNCFRVIGPLYGEFTGHRWIPLTKASDAELWCFFICAWINDWVNSREAGDLSRHRTHYNVTVMWVYASKRVPVVIRWITHKSFDTDWLNNRWTSSSLLFNICWPCNTFSNFQPRTLLCDSFVSYNKIQLCFDQPFLLWK